MGKSSYKGALIGRRKFIQIGATAAVGACLFGIAGCSPQKEASSSGASGGHVYTPGTYTAKANGKKSLITVETTFSDSAITDIQVQHHDTLRIAEAALDGAIPQILDNQTLSVDAVTGATVTTMAVVSAVKDCVKQAGGKVSDLEKPIEKELSTATEEIDADIVILGAGGSGLPAAIIAAKAGAKVVVFEKCGFFGGSLMVSGGSLEYIDAPVDFRPETTDANRAYFKEALSRAQNLGLPQEKIDLVQREWDEWYGSGQTVVYDSINWYALTMCLGSETTDWDSQIRHGETNAPLIEWLTGEIGLTLKKPTVGLAGYPWPEATSVEGAAMGEGYVDGFDDYIEAEGITTLDILFSTPAEDLIVEDGAVVGAKGTCVDGTVYTVRGKQGVIVATGGYAGSPEYLAELVPSMGFDKMSSIPTVNPYGHTGDGLTMGRKIGAMVYGDDYHMFCPCANAKNLTADSYVGDTTNMLLVNKEGKRYVDETLDWNSIALAVMEQPDQMGYLIASSDNAMIDEDGRNAFGDLVEPMLEGGYVVKADTLEELADSLGIPAEALVETVESFNGYCESGEDPEFGRVMFADTAALRNGPYYGTPTTWATLICSGGLLTGENDAVLDESEEPIPGLYAIGEVCSQSGIAAMGYGVRIARRMFA